MWKKLNYSAKQLATPQDRWNASIESIVENDRPNEDDITKNAWYAYSYYSEMESGGHEAFLYHFDNKIKEFGATAFLDNTVQALDKIGAHKHANNLKQNGFNLWTLYTQLEQDENMEGEFIEKITRADKAYYSFDPSLQEYLEQFFEANYHELMNIQV